MSENHTEEDHITIEEAEASIGNRKHNGRNKVLTECSPICINTGKYKLKGATKTMAMYGRRRGYRRGYNGLHGQIRHRPSRRGRFAGRAARRTYRKGMRMSKRNLAKTYANTVGQIAYREYPRRRPMHGGYRGRRRYGRRRY